MRLIINGPTSCVIKLGQPHHATRIYYIHWLWARIHMAGNGIFYGAINIPQAAPKFCTHTLAVLFCTVYTHTCLLSCYGDMQYCTCMNVLYCIL